MALWEVTTKGKTSIEYSDGAYSQSPPISGTWVCLLYTSDAADE